MNRKHTGSLITRVMLLVCIMVFACTALPVFADEKDAPLATGIDHPFGNDEHDENDDPASTGFDLSGSRDEYDGVIALGTEVPSEILKEGEFLSVYTVKVKKGYLALRNGRAFKKSNEIGKLNNGDTVIYCPVGTDKNGYWYVYSTRLRKFGYVNSDYLTYKKTFTNNYKVKVKTGYLALRSKKSFDSSNEKGQMFTGDTVIVLNDLDNTYWTVYSPLLEKTGYTNREYLTRATGTRYDEIPDRDTAEDPKEEEGVEDPGVKTELPLVIPKDAMADWMPGEGHSLQFCCQVKNKSKDKTVTSFELYVYAEDSLGQRISDGVMTYKVTTKLTLEPGDTDYSDYVSLPYRNDICKVYTAVRKVNFSDGSKAVIDKPVRADYTMWEIQ